MAEYYDPLKHLGNPLQHQKMFDFERDTLRVKNPLNADFTFYYDLLPHVVKAQATKDMERYLVRRYIQAMIGEIYNIFTEKKLAEAEAKFRRMHPDTMEDPYLMNTQVYDKIKRADDPSFQEQVVKDCILGVVTKFGRDRVLPRQQKVGQLDPNTPLYMSLIDKFNVQEEFEQAPQAGEILQPTLQPETDTLQPQPLSAQDVTLG